MPSLHLTISDNLTQHFEQRAFALAAHQQIAETVPNATLERCKTVCNISQHYLLADGQKTQGFAQLELKLVSGRNIAVRQLIAQQLSQLLDTHLSLAKQQIPVQTGVVVTEFNRDFTVLG